MRVPLYILSLFRVECLHHSRNLGKEPGLRRFVLYKDKLVVFPARLVRKSNTGVLNSYALNLGEGELPVEPQLFGPER